MSRPRLSLTEGTLEAIVQGSMDGLTQNELADCSGISRTSIRRILAAHGLAIYNHSK